MSEKIQLMIEGGKATANPQMAQSLGPKGINIGDVLSQINEKTSAFKGMKIPITIEIEGKDYTITAGTPPVSELIKKEAGIDKGAGEPNLDKKANLGIEQVIKISKMKQDSILHNNFTSVVKSVIGSCNTLGVLVEGKKARDVCQSIDSGKFKEEIENQVTEMSDEKKKILDEQLKSVQEVLAKEKERVEKEEAEKEKAKEAEKAEAEEGKEETTEEKKAEGKPEEGAKK